METADKKVKLIYEHKGENFLGIAEVPTRSGVLRFKTLIPMVDVRNQVNKYLATQPSEISGDPQLVARLPSVTSHVAKAKARKHLTTAIRVRLGGKVAPHDIAGPSAFAERIANHAHRKMHGSDTPQAFEQRSAYQSAVSGEGNSGSREAAAQGFYARPQHQEAHSRLANVLASDIGSDDIGAFGFLKKIGKGIGKGVKGVGKGIGKGAKAVGKVSLKSVKLVGKGAGKVVSNPITGALLTAVPGGAAAAAIIQAAKGGSPGAKQAIEEIRSAAGDGDPNAIASLAALEKAGGTKPLPMGLIIGGGVGALALIAMATMGRGRNGGGTARLPPLPA